MTGTELGRVMAEVTAQPPVDVDFGAVEHLVRRRRARLAFGAGGGTALGVALVVGLAFVLPGRSSAPSSAPTGPPVSPGPDLTSWQSHSLNGLSWRVPPSWTVADIDYSRVRSVPRPFGGGGPIALLTSFRAASSCTDATEPCVLRIPDDGVFAHVSTGGGDTGGPASENAGSLGPADADCSGIGGTRSFTGNRSFGTEPYAQLVSVTACLGKAAPAETASLLRLVVASLADDSAVTVDSSWQELPLNQLTLKLPPDWTAGKAQLTGNVLFDVSCVVGRPGGVAWTCAPPTFPTLTPQQGVVWISAIAPSGSVEARTKYEGSMPATGACAAAGGKYAYIASPRHLGPQASGEVIIMSACMGEAVPQSTYQEISLMLNTVVDRQYPSAAQLCTAVPGTVSSALATVGDMRLLKWGTARPASDIFPKAAAGDDSAWCWVRDDAHQVFNVWAVHADDAPVKVVDVGLPWFSWGTFAPSVAPTSLIASSFYTLGPSPTPAVAPVTPVPSTPEPTPTAAPAQPTEVASGSTAKALCGSALGTYSTASLTTVGALRSIVWGPAERPLPKVFHGAPASDPAAWCWQAHGSTADIYVVHAGDRAVYVIGDGIGSGPVPSGVPQIS